MTFAPVAIGALAILVRALEALQEPIVFNDGPRFVGAAAAILRGEWRSALGEPFHPLTSSAMALLSGITGLTLEASGELLCVISGGVAAAALYVLTRAQLGRTSATLAGLAFAIYPHLVQSSSGAQSDGLYLAATLVAIACVWRALGTGGTRAAAAAGVACGAAYLVRPEGLLVSLVFGGWLAADLWRRTTPWSRTLELGASFAVALALVTAPYVWALHGVTGTWTLRAPGAAPFESAADADPAGVSTGGWVARVARGLGEMAYDFLGAFTPTAVVLSLVEVR